MRLLDPALEKVITIQRPSGHKGVLGDLSNYAQFLEFGSGVSEGQIGSYTLP